MSRADGRTIHEFWVFKSVGPRICMLRDIARALVMFQESDDDSGLVARAPGLEGTGPSLQVTLQNGQRDEYPAADLVDVDLAIAAIEYFFATSQRTPHLKWVAPAG